MKVMAMYLPQFYRVKENDEWWGEGFTDWVAAKNAKPLYEGHYQPHIPLNGYYDLEKKETMQWQADLMKQYQVDGMCFYHYWFKDGRRILERPAENLLKWTDIDMPFCFEWANESWGYSWSEVQGTNAWALGYEKKASKGSNGVLIEQVYGDGKAWRQHFEYLLPFFRDSRYIKIEGRPVLVIYKPDIMYCLEDMVECWNILAEEAGIGKPYIILSNVKKHRSVCDAELFHEPQKTMPYTAKNEIGGYRKFNYDEVWQNLLNRPMESAKVYYGGYVGYDDAPRRGNAGNGIYGGDPDKFCLYLTELMAKNYVAGNEWVFINAWNEWGEGMHLEPDVKYGYGYLEAIPQAKGNYKNYIDKYSQRKGGSSADLEIRWLREQNAKYADYWKIFDRWMMLKEKGISVARYIADMGYSDLAIYGMGMLGKHLLKEFEAANISIKYIIDRRSDVVNVGVPVHTMSEELPTADAIIVTPTYDWDKIKKELSEMTTAKLLRLDELVMECG